MEQDPNLVSGLTKQLKLADLTGSNLHFAGIDNSGIIRCMRRIWGVDLVWDLVRLCSGVGRIFWGSVGYSSGEEGFRFFVCQFNH